MSKPLPTFTIGVGQAGIEMMKSLAETVERNDASDYFEYLAIDTDTDTLQSVPTGTTQIRLNIAEAHKKEDQSKYKYLTPDFEIGSKGAERQRPVGRYKLDSRGTQDFDDYFQAIWSDIREHHKEVNYSFQAGRDSYNIFLLHSLGGGTGSGTFPLLSAVINRIGKRLDDSNPELDVYTGAVGVAPEVDFDPEFATPPGNPMYYPNTYASLNDLSNMLAVGDQHRMQKVEWEDLEIPLYSRGLDRGGQMSDADNPLKGALSGNSIPIERVPFNDYWIVGVNESLIIGGEDTDFIEGYTEQINRRVGECIYALSEMEQSVENWSSRAKGIHTLGTLGHAKLEVPHDQVIEFCKMKDRREEKQKKVDSVIPSQIQKVTDEKERLEKIKQNPSEIADQLENAAELQQEFESRFQVELGAGNALVRNSSAENVESVLGTIRGDDSESEPEDGEQNESDSIISLIENDEAELLLLATNVLTEMLEKPTAAPAVEEHWEEIVSEQWRAYDMAERAKFGGSATTTLEGKEEALETFYSEKIDEFAAQIEAIDLDFFGKIKDTLPPFHPLTESSREEATRKLETLRNSRDNLLEADGRYRRVKGMKSAVESHRNDAKKLLDQKLNDANQILTERQSALERIEKEIEGLNRSIEREKDELATEGRSERLAIFPLRRDKIDELTLQRTEELESLDDYVEQGFIDEQTVREGINTWADSAQGWNDGVLSSSNLEYSSEVRDDRNSRQEMWLLFHEKNEKYARDGLSRFQGGQQRRSQETGMVDYINDPYTISFVSFYNRGPVEALSLYQRLDSMAEGDQLDAMAGKYGDYRQSFAYPEWYGRDIQKAFTIRSRVTVERPPELDLESVDRGDVSAGEKKNFIKRSGLDTYIWRGTMWEDYEFDPDEDDIYRGWSNSLGLTYTSLQQATPDPELKSRWIAQQADWDDILEAYKQNIENLEQLSIEFE